MTSSLDRLQSFTQTLLRNAGDHGATEADAVAIEGQSISLEVRDGQLEHAERAEGIEIGLRVIIGGRQAMVSAADTSVRTLEEMAARAVAMAREAPVDDYVGLADPDQLAQPPFTDLELCDIGPEPEPSALQDLALRLDAAARSVKGVTQVQSAGASFGRRRMWISGTNGLEQGLNRSSHSLSAVAITGEGLGMERDWASESRIWADDLPPAEEVGVLAGQRTVARAGARRPPTGAFPILYDERVAGGLISHLLAATNGAAIARGASWLRNAMGEAVLPAGLSVTEDPLIPRMPLSRHFDVEGLRTGPRQIVADGVLRTWTLDLATARKLGLQSTASAVRGTSSPPQPGFSNIALTQGDATPEALIAQMGRGLLVTSMLGASVNATTGDYSRGASGFWVENGRIAWPVNECTIAGNLREMLMRITPANDARRWTGQRVPSLLVEGMTVAGA
ncbi:TldD/PmbA family protein [Paracoccus pacificus]|uniref:TldD/PmbA family protein n=1 Tax=Paracoccus pacificus TaxID=1463598 RepID=A0ABW4R3C4_9RHOB